MACDIPNKSQHKAISSAERAGKPCPVCKKPMSLEYRPFCSKRCADVDLHRWLGGGYAIPGEPLDKISPSDFGEDD